MPCYPRFDRIIYFPNSYGVFSCSFVSVACGNSHFENLPQLLQVGETEQLAVTLLFTSKYPAEAVIPPRIKSRPAVLKNSFRFMVLILHFIVRCMVGRFFNLRLWMHLFNLTPFHPPVKTGGYSYSTP